ncbi:transposase [Streptomyces collinus]|uniref:transposase n=1 Tax=Streptomyces collinus TaxID=42684 RepID=UPI0036CA4F1A
MTGFGTSARLASFGGVVPDPRDSGKISGNLRRPQRYNRRIQRVFYTSALFSIRRSEESRRFYDRNRAEGKRHTLPNDITDLFVSSVGLVGGWSGRCG